MEIENVEIKPVYDDIPHHLKPTLKLGFEISHLKSEEIIGVYGYLCINNTIISKIYIYIYIYIRYVLRRASQEELIMKIAHPLFKDTLNLTKKVLI